MQSKLLLLLLVLLPCHRVPAPILSGPIMRTIGGSIALSFPPLEELFLGNKTPNFQNLIQNEAYVLNDSLVVSGSQYAMFGTNLALSIIEANFNQNNSYSDTTNAHAGITSRFVDTSNFAGMALISVTRGVLQEIDRVAGVETYKEVTGLSLSSNTVYKIRVANTTGDDYTAQLLDETGTTVIAGITNTFTAGVPAAGYQCVHTANSAMKVYSFSVKDSSSNVLVNGTPTYHYTQPLFASSYGGAFTDVNGVLSFYADGSFHTANSWRQMVFPHRRSDFTLTGTLNRFSGRLLGICFRSDDAGAGYNFCYDNNATASLKLFKGTINAPTLISSTNATLTANTDYPFTITASGTSLSFTVNGVTLSVTDSTYTATGWIGLVGLSSVSKWSNMVLQ